MSNRMPTSLRGVILDALKTHPDALVAAIDRLGMHRPDGRPHDWQSLSRALRRSMRFPITISTLRDALFGIGRRDIVRQLDTAGLMIASLPAPTSAGHTLQ